MHSCNKIVFFSWHKQFFIRHFQPYIRWFHFVVELWNTQQALVQSLSDFMKGIKKSILKMVLPRVIGTKQQCVVGSSIVNWMNNLLDFCFEATFWIRRNWHTNNRKHKSLSMYEIFCFRKEFFTFAILELNSLLLPLRPALLPLSLNPKNIF